MSQSPMAYTDKNEEDRSVLYAEIARLRAELQEVREQYMSALATLRAIGETVECNGDELAVLKAVRAACEGKR